MGQVAKGSRAEGDHAEGFGDLVSAADAADALNEQVMRFMQLLKSPHVGDGAVVDRSALLLLWPLVHEGPMRISDLAVAKGLDASTVSRQVAQLVKAGLVRRDPDPDDRRASRLVVTDGGFGACRQYAEARRRAISAALQHWDPDRVREFTTLFSEFNQAIERYQNRVPSVRGTAPGASPSSTGAPGAPPSSFEATTPASERARETL
jgi:DNA-binding MarR family transcriptional regulator